MTILLQNKFMSMYPRQDSEELHERSLVDRGRTESVDTTSQQSLNFTREWTEKPCSLCITDVSSLSWFTLWRCENSINVHRAFTEQIEQFAL
ncbi:hypothetical protein J6590_060214 [Homalodisca vitripennis]|nr:hypothetical protein J6590_060214 [Homalodisca vitripennis]